MHLSIEAIIRSSKGSSQLSGWWWPVFIATLWTSVLWIKVDLDPIHFQTVDGSYYRELSEKLFHGKPMVLSTLINSHGKSFSPYPPGFPILLGIVQAIFQSSWEHSAIILHGIMFGLILFIFRKSPAFPPLILMGFSDTSMELACYSWSEFSFFCGLCLLIKFLPTQRKIPNWWSWIGAGFIAFFCFFIRYAGVFLLLYFVIQMLRDKNKQNRIYLAKTALLFLFLVLIWFGYQWQSTGQLTGGDRYPNTDSNLSLLYSIYLETINQVLLFKNIWGSETILFWLGLAVQILFLWSLFSFPKPDKKIDYRGLGVDFMLLSLAYFVFILPTRWYFYFAEPFDFRLLGPGFFLLGIGLFSHLNELGKISISKWTLVIWMACAAFFFYPKRRFSNLECQIINFQRHLIAQIIT